VEWSRDECSLNECGVWEKAGLERYMAFAGPVHSTELVLGLTTISNGYGYGYGYSVSGIHHKERG